MTVRTGPPRPRSARAVRRPPPPGTVVEVRLAAAPGDDRVQDVLRAHRAAGRLVTCRPWGRSPPRLLRWFEVDAPEVELEPMIADLADRVGAANLSVARVSPRRVLLRLIGPIPALCAATFSAGGLCTSCRLHASHAEDEVAPLRILVPRRANARRLLFPPDAPPGARVRLVSAGPYHGRGGLTPRQDEALRVAHRLGFFRYPRGADLGAVAKALGIGRSSTLELLRSATGRLVDERLGTDLRPRK
jgi:hypothetical protein